MEQLGPYTIEHEIARGAMGVVYRARGPVGPVAIKVLLDVEHDPRFVREAQVGFALKHPAIVAVRDLQRDAAGRHYLVMDWVDGESLQARLKRDGPLPVDEALRIGQVLADALIHAHEHGALHRDLKPANVLLDRQGQPRLTDFGLTRTRGDARLTQSGVLLGTPGFMAPEQVEGVWERVGPRADVYGLGATLYALLTGSAPFTGGTAISVVNAQLHSPPPSAQAARAEVPDWLDAVLLRCLALDPLERYMDMPTLRRALEPPAAARGPGRLRVAAVLIAAGLGVGLAWLGAGAAQAPTAGSPPPAASPVEGAPLDWKTRVEQALQLVLQNRRPEADALLAPALDHTPTTAYGFVARAIARPEGQPGEAEAIVADLDHALALDPELPLAWIMRSRVARLQEDLPQAETFSARAVALAPELPRALAERAVVLAGLGRGPEAHACLDRAYAVAVGEARDRLDYDRAEVLLALGDAAAALALLDALVIRWPTLPTVHWLRANALHTLDRRDEALTALARATELDPTAARLLKLAGLASHYRRDAEAVGHFYRLLERDPDSVEGHMGLGNSLVRLGRLAEAERAFTRVIALDPEQAVAYVGRAVARGRDRARWAAARGDAERALELDPDARMPRLILGKLWADSGAPETGLIHLDAALVPSGRFPAARRREAYAYRASCHAALGHHEQAWADLERAGPLETLAPEVADMLRRLRATLERSAPR